MRASLREPILLHLPRLEEEAEVVEVPLLKEAAAAAEVVEEERHRQKEEEAVEVGVEVLPKSEGDV